MKQKITFFTLLLVLLQLSVFAQWKAKLSLGSSYYSGNVNKFDFQSDGAVSHADSLFEFSSFYKVRYGEVEFIQNNEEYSGGVKFDYSPKSLFSPFIVFSAFKNDYKNIASRYSGIGGAKYVYYRTATSDFSLSIAYQFDIDKYVSDAEDRNKSILSVRPKFKQKIGESIEIENITFYKPNLSDFEDYYIESSTSLTNKLTETIYIKLSYDVDYVNKPTKEELETTDQAVIVSIVLKF